MSGINSVLGIELTISLSFVFFLTLNLSKDKNNPFPLLASSMLTFDSDWQRRGSWLDTRSSKTSTSEIQYWFLAIFKCKFKSVEYLFLFHNVFCVLSESHNKLLKLGLYSILCMPWNHHLNPWHVSSRGNLSEWKWNTHRFLCQDRWSLHWTDDTHHRKFLYRIFKPISISVPRRNETLSIHQW